MASVVMQQHAETIVKNLDLLKPFTSNENIAIVRILLKGERTEASKDWMRKTFGEGLANDLVQKMRVLEKSTYPLCDHDKAMLSRLNKSWALAEAIDESGADSDPEHYINIALGRPS